MHQCTGYRAVRVLERLIPPPAFIMHELYASVYTLISTNILGAGVIPPSLVQLHPITRSTHAVRKLPDSSRILFYFRLENVSLNLPSPICCLI